MPAGRRGAAMAALVLSLVACSGSNSAAPKATTTTLPPTYPLTGLAATDRATVARPAVSVKVDNVAAARPQAGLDAADVVYEEVVEGGLTRLLAVYQSTDAALIGPVRSVRPTDPDLVAPFGGLFGYSGAAARFDQMIRSTAGLTVVGPDDDKAAYSIRGPHTGEHRTYTSTQALYRHAPAGARPPPAFAPFLKPGQPFGPAALPAAHVAMTVGTVAVGYDWDPAAGSWRRSMDRRPDVLQSGAQLTATTVVVELVGYQPVPGAFDAAGSQVEVAKVVGSGDAWIFGAGMVVKGRWSKPSSTALTAYTDPAGNPVALPPGRTWVELPASGSPPTVT